MDLIDRDELLKEYDLAHCVKYGNKDAKQQYHSYDTLMMYEIADMIRDAPSVDAEPVRHGYWIIRGGDMLCSECGYGDVTEFGEPEDYRYCPNCGAKMGEGAE